MVKNRAHVFFLPCGGHAFVMGENITGGKGEIGFLDKAQVVVSNKGGKQMNVTKEKKGEPVLESKQRSKPFFS